MSEEQDPAATRGLRAGLFSVRVQADAIFRQPAQAFGGELPLAAEPATLSEALRRAAESDSGERLTHVRPDGTEVHQSYRGLLTDAERILSGLRAGGLRAGDKAILQAECSEDILPAFWGCVLGRIVPVVTPVPHAYTQPHRLLDQLVHIWGVLERPAVVVCESLRPAVPALARSLNSEDLRVLSLDRLRDCEPDREHWPAQADDPAFFALTSGSTKLPKCAILTHRNVLQRAAGANQLGRHSTADVALNWLPFDHIGSLSDWHLRCVLLGCRAVYVPKEYVLAQPLRWFDLIDRHGVTHTWAPNFAYKLLNELLTKAPALPWNLSHVKAMLTAGETVSPNILQCFADLLAPCGLSATALRPAFGMAEMASGVTYYVGDERAPIRIRHVKRSTLRGQVEPAAANAADAVGLVSLGPPIPGVGLRIVDDGGNLVREDVVGHLQVQGGPVSRGYYGSPGGNDAFHEDGWFETGDLGLLCGGELYLVGRAKESIIVNGVNYGCGEIEELVDEMEGVLPSFSAACPVRAPGVGHEQFAVFFHTTHTADGPLSVLLKQIRRHLARQIGIQPDYLIPVPKESIPKTALGKLQRGGLTRRFEAGEFEPIVRRIDSLLKNGDVLPGSPDAGSSPRRALAAHSLEPRERTTPSGRGVATSDVERRLSEIWMEVLGLSHVGLRDNLFELGGNSVLLVQLHSRIEAAFGPRLSVVDMFKYPTIEALSRLLGAPEESAALPPPALRGRERAEGRKRRHAGTRARDVAVVGLACRFPGAANAAQFWQNLAGGVESISSLSEEQILAAGIAPKLARDPRYVRAAAILDGVEQFDADFFGYTAREAQLMDPQQRVLLECAWEAMEDAGYDLRSHPGAVGVFVSGVLNTYLLNHVFPHVTQRADTGSVMTLSSTDGFQVMVANDKDYLPTRLSYKLNLRGPSVNVQTACSSSLVAIHLAAQSLLDGECEMALAGGVSIAVPQETGYLYQEGLLVSPDGHCRAFDADAQGTVFGNGAGVVLLKRLSDAEADGDRIYAVIKGSAVNNDGGEKAGYLAPSQDGQAAVVAEALAAAGIEAASISYVEAHGTGTALGDPIEIAGLCQAFRADTDRRQFCAVGSVKTNVGHLQIASGVAGFIKTALALHHRQLVPSLHFRTPNPRIDFANSPFYINTRFMDWPRGDGPRRATVNSLGIGGTNVHLVLEESPDSPRLAGAVERPRHILVLSARTRDTLKELAGRWTAAFDPTAAMRLGDACFTAAAGRAHFRERLAIVADGWPKLCQSLQRISRGESLPDGVVVGSAGDVRPRIAFLFAGRGPYDIDGAREMYDSSPSFRQWLGQCDSILKSLLNESLVEKLYAESNAAERLRATPWWQPAVFAVEYGLARLWMSWGIEPSAVIGAGVGEYVAACIAGVFSPEDAMKLISHPARWMPESNDPMVEEFREMGARVALAPPQIPLISLNGRSTAEDFVTVEYWCRRLREPGTSRPAVAAAIEGGCDVLLEMLPSGETQSRRHEPSLPSVVPSADDQRGTADCLRLPSLDRERSAWDTMLTSLATLYVRGATVDWTDFDRDYARRRMSLPTYPFQRKRHWIERPDDGMPRGVQTTLPEKGGHALPGRRVTSPALEDIVFESQVGPESLPILDDHRFCATPILPGAFQLVMALDAAALAGIGPGIAIEDVIFAKAVAVADGEQRVVQVILSKAEDPGRALRIVSRPSENADADSWTVHSVGRIVSPRAEAERVPVQVRQRHEQLLASPQRIVSREEFYATMRKHQVQLGSSFQAVDEAWVGDGEAVCRIRLPEAIPRPEPWLRQALLVDACVQILGGIEQYPADHVRLPTAIGRFCLLEPPSAESLSQNLARRRGQAHFAPKTPQNEPVPDGFGTGSEHFWCYLRVAPRDSAAPNELTADAWLVDPSGQLIATLAGLRIDEVPREVLLKALGRDEIDWVYRPSWVHQPTPSADATRRLLDGPWLIFADESGVGSRLATLLEQRGTPCVVVRAGKQFVCESEGRYQIDPGSPQDFSRLMDATGNTSADGYRGVVYLWALDQPADPRRMVDSDCSCAGALYLVQALARAGCKKGLDLCLVTRGAQAVEGGGRPLNVWQTPLWGFARTVALEYPEIKCLRVDLAPDSGVEQARSLFDELCLDSDESEIALRGDRRFVLRWERQALQTPASVPVRSDATYLVTGGTGGLGLHVAAWLVEQGARHLVLLSRRGAISEDARRAVAQWSERGIHVEVAAADVGQEADLSQVFARIRAGMPALRGIVHAAGARDDGVLERLSWARFKSVLQAKAIGVWNLHRQTMDLPLDFFLGFSSIASLLGSPGQANYAAANAFLDGLMHDRCAVNLPGLAVNWGPWDDVGMTAALSSSEQRALARRGLMSLDASEAVLAIPSLIRSGEAQLAAARIDWPLYLGEVGREADATTFAALFHPGEEPHGGQTSFRVRLEQTPEEQRYHVLFDYVCDLVGGLLGVESAAAIDLDRGFTDLGLDSLGILMLWNRLQADMAIGLPATLAFKFSNLTSLVGHLADTMGVSPPAADQRAGAGDNGRKAGSLEQLPLPELADRLAATLAAIRRDHGAT